jgi:hypothetical protein
MELEKVKRAVCVWLLFNCGTFVLVGNVLEARRIYFYAALE